MLSILITAPLGAIAIVLTGPRLLQKSDIKELDEADEEEELSHGYMEATPNNGGTHKGDAVEMQPGAKVNGVGEPAERRTLLNENHKDVKAKFDAV